jgi:2-oxoglutarate ferredoxin oxidoreductase subunit gamma
MERAVRFAGSGGQGIALAALLLAEGAVQAGMNATHSQAYGPQSRGGASKADVIIADGPIPYPIAARPDVLVALSDEACARYLKDLLPGGLALLDESIAAPERADITIRSLPIVAEARRALGATLGANLVALGAITALAGLVPADAVARAVERRRPGGDPERALRAFHAGEALARSAKEAVPM